ncbi:MAG: 2,4-dihydroxyhept-2-ene-1,7-dioic acid aldolase [Lentisphaerae bacterium]|jgi:2-keto-3-deoxy-L-rhamnonate aldolase RhmA|nr:2,4-dihydroxyhept-2-ene-1,7-dioic acid aldolase [Lentisphaerota bacterium]MBT4818011.1 2,4-dihydroxyhept-2-ene-1,7-dioic acid aldolase [Lentisphaerota bacterium]MBT5607258.1 2,4-dihydroxyhept-2-ene-1,7-dioic acid aldolase [Lentisphaerota bacterium]MBT7058813.1 2,4-dihydroxyhept-2-ene-1,7-dioic acid aldolase [Lentisphaerota bacterium]MBT7842377.1 2,4-dihydroxyhept-2-ene-1,7-dioic acid aldolase [Lentisphaerota bacterium]
MKQATLATKVRNGEVTIGTWIQAGHPTIAEVLAEAGFDWIAADCEHTDIDMTQFAGLARAMYGRGPAPLVRVRENDTLAIRQVLDMGAEGVIVPLVNSPAEAEAAVRAAKYPPQGVRGFAFSRMNDWGETFEDYLAQANSTVLVIVMIESREGVENIDDILAVPGVDGVFIGPYDMSGSYGIPGQTQDPIIKAACAQVAVACKQAGKAAGIHVVLPSAAAIQEAVADGFTFIAVGVDTVFLAEAAKSALTCARTAAAL